MHKYHQDILGEIKRSAGKGTKHSWDSNYLGSKDFHYNISNPIKRQIIKNWITNHQDLSLAEFTRLLDSLYKGKSYEEKTMAGYLLGYLPKFRKQIDIKLLDGWLDYLNGWAEIDTTCQGNFTVEELLSNWTKWEKFIKKLSEDKNINKRRASLVLLTGPVSHTDDKKISGLAFEIIDILKSEKDILITKAISWLLRDLTKLHKKALEDYLRKNEKSLPKIAIREVKRKLLTGRK